MTHNQKSLAFLIVSLSVLLVLFLCGVISVYPQTNMGPIRTPQLNTNLYVGQSGYATIQSAVTFACRTGNQSFAVYIPPGASPSDTPTAVTGGCSGTYIADLRGMPLRYYTWTGTAYVLTVSETGIAHTLNLLTGDGNGNALDSTIAASNVALLNATINNFTGAIHTGAGSQVNNSPICTEATGCPGTNVTYPPAGIGVSTGTAWSSTSINPSTLATWPAAGIPVSTGTAWQSPIDPTDVPRLSAANTLFSGALHFANATRLNAGTDLSSLNTCGDFDVVNPANGPPQLGSTSTIGVHVWCTGDSTYLVQFAWNMIQFGQPTEIFARNNRAGTWTAWTSIIFDDGSGNVTISGTAHVGGLAMGELINTAAMQTVGGLGCSISGLGDACIITMFLATPEPDLNYFPFCSTTGSGLIPMNFAILSSTSFNLQLGGFGPAGGGSVLCLVLRSGGFATALIKPPSSASAPTPAPPTRATKCVQGAIWVRGDYIEACTDGKGTVKHVRLTRIDAR